MQRGWKPLGWCTLLLVAGMSVTSGRTLADAPSMRVLPGITKKISNHVHVIPANGRAGVPNVGIVVGTRAVLVIDSGLGAPSGRTVAAEIRKIAGGRRIYAVATHWHVEHLGGEQGLPAGVTVLRPHAQQRELDADGGAMVKSFRALSADNQHLLENFASRSADVILDGDATIDLGGVQAEILAAGPAHTDGDTAVLIRQDGVLFTGDVVQRNYAPVMSGMHSSIASWLDQVSRLEALPSTIVVPSHSAITDHAAFAGMREMLVFIRDRWAVIRATRSDRDQAARQLVLVFKARFPTCDNADLLAITAAHL